MEARHQMERLMAEGPMRMPLHYTRLGVKGDGSGRGDEDKRTEPKDILELN